MAKFAMISLLLSPFFLSVCSNNSFTPLTHPAYHLSAHQKGSAESKEIFSYKNVFSFYYKQYASAPLANHISLEEFEENYYLQTEPINIYTEHLTDSSSTHEPMKWSMNPSIIAKGFATFFICSLLNVIKKIPTLP